jgi:hypothetical protein
MLETLAFVRLKANGLLFWMMTTSGFHRNSKSSFKQLGIQRTTTQLSLAASLLALQWVIFFGPLGFRGPMNS